MSHDLSTEFLQDLYEHAPCGYIFTHPDGAIARVNETFLAWTGYTRDNLGSARFQDLLTTPGKIFFENQFAPLLRMQGSVKEVAFDLLRKDGDRLPVLVNSTVRSDKVGEPLLIATTIFDATDRQRYEHELWTARENAEQLATIVRSANDAIVRATPAGLIETWNTGAERLFGYTPEEIIGRSLWSLLPLLAHDVERDQILTELRAGRAVLLDTVGKHAHHHDIDLSVGLIAHLGLLGELDALSAIIRDISERRALERLQQEFLAMTSHELRHPLTVIKGHAHLMQRRARFNEEDVNTIIDQTERLEHLIDDLLLASLIEADRFDVRLEPTDLVTEVRTAVEQLATDEYPVHFDAPAEPLVVLGDRHRLGQVFTNLLTNAIKYSSEGSEIVVQLRPGAEYARVDVIDRGFGIPSEVIPRLFSRFYRADGVADRTSGLGLGLYIAQRIVWAHGGDIGVTSEVGAGSTFTITIPLHVV
jgi:PAS domain S-box-containing protein